MKYIQFYDASNDEFTNIPVKNNEIYEIDCSYKILDAPNTDYPIMSNNEAEQIITILKKKNQELPEFIPWDSPEEEMSPYLRYLRTVNIAPYKWQPPTGKDNSGAGWKKIKRQQV